MSTKLCSKCNIIKNEDEFYHQNGKPAQPCKACKKAYIQAAKYEEDPNYPMVTFKRGPGRPRKDHIVLEVPSNVSKEEPTVIPKVEIPNTNIDTKNKIVIMDMSVFHTAIRLAFEKGQIKGKEFDELKIKEVDLEPMIEQILEENSHTSKEN